MGGLISSIRAIISNTVHVEVTPYLVTFRYDGQEFSLEPVVFMAPDAIPVRILGFADCEPPQVPTVRVYLFQHSLSTVSAAVRGQCLEHFFRYAMFKFRTQTVVARPFVIFRGIQSLGDSLWADPETVLGNAVLRAGACHYKVEA